MIDNISSRQHCAYCDNTGFVVIDTGTPLNDDWEQWRRKVNGMPLAERRRRGLDRDIYGEAMGPCPHCERGSLAEFPPEGATLRPPWGKEGFWRGRSTTFLTPVNTGSPPLPKAENLQRMRQLRDRIAGIADTMNMP